MLFSIGRAAGAKISGLLLLLLCSTVTSATSKDSQIATFDFPTDHTLGLIYVLDRDSTIKNWPPSYKATGQVQARGRVNLPRPCRIGLRATSALTLKPHFLLALAKSPGVNLEILDLTGVDINDNLLAAVEQCKQLMSLDLAETDLEDAGLKHVANLTELRHLTIYRTLLTGVGIDYLGNLSKLQNLNLNGNELAHGTVKKLAKFPSLNDLQLSHCQLDDTDIADLAGLKNLQGLSISFNYGVDDRALPSISKLKKLHSLNIEDTRITARGLVTAFACGHPTDLSTINLPASCRAKKDRDVLQRVLPKTELLVSDKMKKEVVELLAPLK